MAGTSGQDRGAWATTGRGRAEAPSLLEATLLCEAGGRPVSLDLDDIRQVRLWRRTPRRRELSLVPGDGRRVTLAEGRSAADGEFVDFACALVDRFQGAPSEPDFVLGPPVARWILALFGLVTAAAIICWVFWVLVTQGASAVLAVPFSVGAINLAMIWPLVTDGPPRKVDRARFRARLLED